MIAVIGDILPKLEELTTKPKEKIKATPKVQEVQAPPPPVSPPSVIVETPVHQPEPAPPQVPIEPPAVPEVPAPPAMSEQETKIAEITAETLGYLELLGGEVFEQRPVSKYFDDWMVNLRQIVMSFESSDVIGPDETFSKEYNQIFANIEDELAKRIENDASIEVSARTLVENRYLLNKIDEGYAAQTKEFVAKGTSAIEQLMQSMQSLEKELTEVQQIKTSYRHPLQKMAKDQKIAELTQKLTAAKKRLAVAVGSSSVDRGKSGDIDTNFAAQSAELEAKREVAMELLTANVNDLQNTIEELKKIKTNNPIKKLSIQQGQFELGEKLLEAKKRLEIAEKSHSDEMEKLRAEYEKKKQDALGKVQTLEKDIATKEVDNSAGVRKEAAKTLADAVKALVARKTAKAPSIGSDSKPPEAPTNAQS
jgi:vacuolar-type H+-ATPase subunit I/STV1